MKILKITPKTGLNNSNWTDDTKIEDEDTFATPKRTGHKIKTTALKTHLKPLF